MKPTVVQHCSSGRDHRRSPCHKERANAKRSDKGRNRHHNSSTTKSKLSTSMHRPTDEELDSRRLTSLQLLGALKPETLRGDLNDQTTLGFLGTFTAQSKNLRYLRRP
jgi:hypothetical protein